MASCRVVAFTALNAQSSRSHGIVMLTIIKRPSSMPKNRAVGQKVKIGRLFMVDLAGSERLKKSRSTGEAALPSHHKCLRCAQALSVCGTLPETLPQQCSRGCGKPRMRSVHVVAVYYIKVR